MAEATETEIEFVMRRLKFESELGADGPEPERNAGVRTRATELIGKRNKLFTDKVELSGSVQVVLVDSGVRRGE